MGPGAGPGPPGRGRGRRARRRPSAFEEGAQLPTRTYCGGPTKDHILESGGSGVALLDYDGDGRLDVYLVTAAELTHARERVPHTNALYRNLGGWRFEDVSQQGGCRRGRLGQRRLRRRLRRRRPPRPLRHELGPQLPVPQPGRRHASSEVAAQAGVAAVGLEHRLHLLRRGRRRRPGPLRRALRRDHLGRRRARPADARLAQRAAHHGRARPDCRGESDLFFENLGEGRFVEATEAHGLADPARGYGFGVVATDYDDDGAVDLFVANDSTPNFLYRNRGDGRFESVGLLAGVAVNAEARAQAGMGADAGDYDGDGRTDIVLTAFAHDTNTLYRNLDGRQFEDASAASGLSARTFERMGWGASFLDADLDGRLDLFFANGHIFADVGGLPAARRELRAEEPAAAERGRPLPRRLGERRRRAAARAGGPRPGRGRPRRRRRPRPRREQHGRRADAAREPPAHRPPLGRLPRRLARAGTASRSARR